MGQREITPTFIPKKIQENKTFFDLGKFVTY